MNSIDLQTYGIARPEKVIWRCPAGLVDPLAGIKSKSLKQFLTSADSILETAQITWKYHTLTDQEFLDWLPYYKTKMAENDYEIIASPEWLQKKREQQLEIEGLFFYKNDQLVGSGIFTRDKLEKATFAFKASDRIDLTNKQNSSLGSIIDFFFIREMVKQQVKIISAGRSRNAFGVINTLGYLDYKLRLGYEPQLDEKSVQLNEVPLNENGVVLFYGIKEGKTSLFALKPTDSTQQFEQSRFATPELPFIELTY